jgi:hypothetical protein
MDALEARALGRPKEQVEVAVNPVQRILDMPPEERAALRAAIQHRLALEERRAGAIEGEAVEVEPA